MKSRQNMIATVVIGLSSFHSQQNSRLHSKLARISKSGITSKCSSAIRAMALCFSDWAMRSFARREKPATRAILAVPKRR